MVAIDKQGNSSAHPQLTLVSHLSRSHSPTTVQLYSARLELVTVNSGSGFACILIPIVKLHQLSQLSGPSGENRLGEWLEALRDHSHSELAERQLSYLTLLLFPLSFSFHRLVVLYARLLCGSGAHNYTWIAWPVRHSGIQRKCRFWIENK